MDRRSFFKSLAIMAGTLALDPEELLWRPTKTIFIPPTWSAYEMLECKMTAALQAMMRRLEQELYAATALPKEMLAMGNNPVSTASCINEQIRFGGIPKIYSKDITGPGRPALHFKQTMYGFTFGTVHRGTA